MEQLPSGFDQTLRSATEQAFSVILFTEVAQRQEAVMLDPLAPAVHATIHLASAREDMCVVLTLRCARTCAALMAARMLQIASAEADNDQMIDDVMGEIANVLGGGLKTAVEEQITDLVLGLPEIQEQPTGELPPLPEHASVLHFSDGADMQFSLALMKEVACARTCHR